MGKWREVAAGADAALGRYYRMHSAVEHLAKDVNDGPTYARKTLGQGISSQQHHGAGNVFGERLSYSNCMRAQQIHLQFTVLLGSDAHITELSDTGGDCVSEFV